MKEVLENIKSAENDAHKKIELAKKKLSDEYLSALKKGEEICKSAEEESVKIIEQSLVDAERKALDQANKLRDAQKEAIAKIASAAAGKSDAIVKNIVSEFGKWR